MQTLTFEARYKNGAVETFEATPDQAGNMEINVMLKHGSRNEALTCTLMPNEQLKLASFLLTNLVGEL